MDFRSTKRLWETTGLGDNAPYPKRLRSGDNEKPVTHKALGKYAKLIHHPTRIFCIGRSQMGKTTLSVQVIMERFANLDRYIVICPSWDQPAYNPIRDWFKPCDVYRNPQRNTFDKVVQEIRSFNEFARRKGVQQAKTFILFDDNAGTSVVHSNGKGSFPNFSTQVTHEGCSLMVISQEPKRADPTFRHNCENFIVFPSEAKYDVDWLNESFNSPIFGKGHNFYDVLSFAWTAGKGKAEFGKHFMFIHSAPRTYTRFYCDFNNQIKRDTDQ